MKLFEHQAKELFAGAGIPVPAGQVIENAGQIENALSTAGLPCVIKAQVLQGGRGKSGLIQMADTVDDACAKAAAIWAAPQGVQTLLIEEQLDIAGELYLSVTFDPATGTAAVMACAEGGVDIEEVATRAPDSITREPVNVLHGLLPFNVRNVVTPLGLAKDSAKAVSKIVGQLYKLFRSADALLVEINPLVVTSAGDVIAADAKITIDDNALYRQPFKRTLEAFANKVEYEAAREGIPYLQFDGDIGLMCAGAGLTNTVHDLIHDFGGRPANFLEFGGPNYRKAMAAMRLTLMAKPRVILIVTFGTIARADVMAEGIAEAIKELKPKIPIITAIRGTGEEKAMEILRSVGLEPLSDTEEAVKKAIAAARGNGQGGAA